MLKDVIPQDEFARVRELLAEGEELKYSLILANIYKYGLQKLEFTVCRGSGF